MRILITGIAGLIGSNMARWLIQNTEHDIFGIDNISTGYVDNIPVNAHWELCDILNQKQLKHLFDTYKPEVCYHFAAYAAEGRSNYIRSFIHENNTVGTSNIINLCVNYNCKLIFTSSVAVYSGTPPFDEEDSPCPIDSYGVSKYCSEMDIQIAGRQQGLFWNIIRPRNVYGPGQSLWDTQRNVMGIWMNQILNKRPMTIFGDGNNKRSFTYIEDILPALYNSIHIKNQVINIGSGIVYSIKQANEILQKISGYDNVAYLDPRHEQLAAFCDTEKSERLLVFEDQTKLVDGIAKMWQWAKKQPNRKMQIPPALEILKTNHSSIV